MPSQSRKTPKSCPNVFNKPNAFDGLADRFSLRWAMIILMYWINIGPKKGWFWRIVKRYRGFSSTCGCQRRKLLKWNTSKFVCLIEILLFLFERLMSIWRIPNDLYIAQLSPDEAKIINDNWPYRSDHTEHYIRSIIALNADGCFGVYDKSTNELLSYMLTEEHLCMG